MAGTKPFVYRSAAASEFLESWYETVLEKWPVAYVEHRIDTPFGSTYVIACGESEAQPLVLLHGVGMNSGTWRVGCDLEPFALRFVEAGFAALTYDYRHFGASAGEPRQHFSLDKQADDCRAAIAYARSRPEIDGERIALWGTSAGGGYGFVIAAQDGGINCISGQCTSLDHGADGKPVFQREGMPYMLRLLMHAQREKGRSRFGLSPHRMPIVGRPGTTALMNAPGAIEGYAGLAGPDRPLRRRESWGAGEESAAGDG